MSDADVIVFKEICGWIAGSASLASFMWWLLRKLITHYFSNKMRHEVAKDALDKERIARQNDATAHAKEISLDLKDRQRELSDSYSQVSEIISGVRGELRDIRQDLKDLRQDIRTLRDSVDRANQKYDALLTKFLDYVPAVNNKLKDLESRFGKIIPK